MNGIAIACLWFGGLALHGLATPMTPPVRAAIAIGALVVHALLRARPQFDARAMSLRAVALIAIATAWALLPAAPAVRGPLYALSAAALGAPAGATTALLAASLLTTIAAWLPGASALGVATASLLYGAPAGPTAVGLPAMLWALIFLAPRARALTWSRLGLALGLILAAALLADPLAQFWHHRLGSYSGDAHAGHNHPLGLFARIPLLLCLCAAALLVAWWKVADAAPMPAQRMDRRNGRRLAAAAFGGALLALLVGGWRAPGAPDRRIAVLNVGGMDWDRPNWEAFGSYSGGMFGLLPRYLRDAGWQVEALSEEELPSFGLSRARVLVMINGHRLWSEAERGRIEAFLRDGGSLLMIGDHTDVFGLMRGFNSLTVPWGVEFRYDSAYHHGGGWTDDLEWKPGGLGAWRDPREAFIGIGASLALRPPARALLTARTSFSDFGEPENFMGSFLGNYAPDPGERVGDLCLIAERDFGRGRALIYGDTSGFQNGSLPVSFAAHIAPMLETLARPRGFALPFALEAALALLAAALLLLAPAMSGATVPRVLLAGGLGFALVSAALTAKDESARLAGVNLDRALLVDESTLPEIGHYSAEWNSPGPLASCAFRSDLSVWHQRDWSGETVRRARGIALIGPRITLSKAQAADLDAACAAGATVLVAAAHGDEQGVADWLARHGVRLAATRMGSVPPQGRQSEDEPRFLDASPLLLAPGLEATELYRYGEHLLAVAVPVGAGFLVVIGDTRFFSTTNVEGTWGWWGGNLRFLHDLVGVYLDGAPEAVAPLLPPPSKPPEDA